MGCFSKVACILRIHSVSSVPLAVWVSEDQTFTVQADDSGARMASMIAKSFMSFILAVGVLSW